MSHSRNLLAGLLAFLAAGWSLTATADVLHLVSGDRLTGEIDSIGGGKVILNTDFAGTIAVKLETVKHMESEKVFEMIAERCLVDLERHVVPARSVGLHVSSGVVAHAR